MHTINSPFLWKLKLKLCGFFCVMKILNFLFKWDGGPKKNPKMHSYSQKKNGSTFNFHLTFHLNFHFLLSRSASFHKTEISLQKKIHFYLNTPGRKDCSDNFFWIAMRSVHTPLELQNKSFNHN